MTVSFSKHFAHSFSWNQLALRSLFSAALNECGVSFSLLTAGAETRLIKDSDEEWGPIARAKAHAALRFDDAQSNVADAILFASHLAQQGASSNTGKIVFVITDGFDSAPKRLRQSLSVAEAQDVVVVGIGIGFFTEAVFDFFRHYVVVNDPKLLPQGLHCLFSGQGSSARPMRQFFEEDKVLTSAQAVWDREMRKVYEDLVERNRAALYLTVSPIRQKGIIVSLDVCFVVDTNGSMKSHLQKIRRYVVTMANDMKTNMARFGKTGDLRMACCAYKYFGYQSHLEKHDFSNDIDSVIAAVNKMNATGRVNIEDKFSGLRMAMSFDWQAAARFLVLIGDKPDHALYCRGCNYCVFIRQIRSPGGILELVRNMARQKIYLLYVRIAHHTCDEEKLVEDAYVDAAPADMKTKGFTLLDLTSEEAADTLMSKIRDVIDKIIAEEFM